MPVRWMLFDYAGVLSLPQSAPARAALEAAAMVDPDRFWAAFWQQRQPYDAGAVTAAQYWSSVAALAGADWSAGQMAELTGLDVASWLRPNTAVVGLLDRLRAGGYRLAVLSNAPVELADAASVLAWLAPFEHLFFSCHLRLTKPDPRCYRATLDRLQAEPDEVLFVDDREENVAAAVAIGLPAIQFTGQATVARIAAIANGHGG